MIEFQTTYAKRKCLFLVSDDSQGEAVKLFFKVSPGLLTHRAVMMPSVTRGVILTLCGLLSSGK